jgi:molybdopterin converting factor small subunit
MSIKIHLHSTHRQHAEGQAVVETDGRTVGECLQELVTRYPDLEAVLFDKKGGLRRNLEIYLNLESAYPDELARAVKDGDQIHVTVMLTGG